MLDEERINIEFIFAHIKETDKFVMGKAKQARNRRGNGSKSPSGRGRKR